MSDNDVQEAPNAGAAVAVAPAFEIEEETLLEGADRRSVRYIFGRLMSNTSSVIGTLLLVFFAVVALAAPILAPCPDDPREGRRCRENAYQVPKYGYSSNPQPPSETHWFGTTTDQYDIYYGVVWGARTAFKVGIIIVACALLIGLTIGSISAYYGGLVDEVLMRIVEIFQAFPFLLAAITLATILRTRPQFQGILPAMMALIVFGWTGYARLVRADILTVKQRDYVWAARSLGASDFHIITRHVLPNSIFPVLVVASLDIGTYVLTFAALSFFGIGVPQGYADWGQMIASARNRIPSLEKDWYIVAFPGVAIILFSLAWNLIGDAFRDILDPRLTGGKGA
jgi:peptide/nickel transport system permease protein